jgi:hypothetical protein
MFKKMSVVVAAAAIAGVFTSLSVPCSRLDAGPLAEPAATMLHDCKQRAWPYLNCIGTPIGNPKIRLVTTDRLMH